MCIAKLFVRIYKHERGFGYEKFGVTSLQFETHEAVFTSLQPLGQRCPIRSERVKIKRYMGIDKA